MTNLPIDDTGRGFALCTKSEADERCIQRCYRGYAQQSHEMTNPRPFKENPGARSRGWSRWNTLPGTGATGAFHEERQSYPKLGYIFPESKPEPLKILLVLHLSGMRGRSRSRSKLKLNQNRQYSLLRVEAPATADTFPDHIGVSAGITQNC